MAALIRSGQVAGTILKTDANGQLAGLTEKASPTTSDVLLIEDAAASNAKKYITIADLLSLVPTAGLPDNLPELRFYTNSTVQCAAKGDSSSTLRVTLQDTNTYTATAPLYVDLSTSGLGGLDTGSEAASTWYYIYAVPDTGSAFDVVASVTSPVGGSGPTGYSYWKYLGAIYNKSNSSIAEFSQCGTRFLYWQRQTEASLGTGSDATAQYIDLAFVPATATFYEVEPVLQVQTSTYWDFLLWVDGALNAGLASYAIFSGRVSTGNSGYNSGGRAMVPKGTNPGRIYYQRAVYSGSALASSYIYTNGWVDGYLV